MKILRAGPVRFVGVALVTACAPVGRSGALSQPDQRSASLFLTFRPTPDQPSDAIPGFHAPCPLKVEYPSDGAQMLLRRALERDSVDQTGVGTVRYPRALGDYQVLVPGALGLGENDWLRLDCQTLRSVAVVPRGA